MGGAKGNVGDAAGKYANINNNNNNNNNIEEPVLLKTLHTKIPAELMETLKDIAFKQHKPLKVVIVDMLQNGVELHGKVKARPQWQKEREAELAEKRGGKR
jgi:hypothetical protein